MSRPFLIGIFVLSLAFRLWFNFAYPHTSSAGAADGSEYLRLAEALRIFFSQSNGDLSILSGFKQSGPVFPLFILVCQYAGSVFGNFPQWMAPVFGQCILASVADVFLCLISDMLWGRHAARACAVFSVLYPAYLINSGRLYSESFSTSICVIVLYLMCRGFLSEKRTSLQVFALGFCLAALQLARSVMILLSAIALPLTFLQERKSSAVKSLSLLVLGMCLVLVPWLFAQKAIFNKASLVVDRVGNYNLFVGTRPDIGGWLSYPYPDGTGVEKRSAISVLADNVRQSPSRFAKLMLDKPYRLGKFPWNDFRIDVGFYTFALQVAFHQLLLLLCTVGLSMAFVRNDDGTSPCEGVFRGRLLLFFYLASHVVYFLFITVPRYNMTATPVLIVFAAAGAAAIISIFKLNAVKGIVLLNAFFVCFLAARLTDIGPLYGIFASPVAALSVLCLIKGMCALLFFYVLWTLFPRPKVKPLQSGSIHLGLTLLVIFLVVYPARANGRAFEWEACLKQKGDRIVQEIAIRKADIDTLINNQMYILIDTDGAKDFIENGAAKVNGEVLKGPLIPGLALNQDFSAAKLMNKDQVYFECEWIYDCMTREAGIASSGIRQWFVMVVPPDAVKKALASGSLFVEIENITGRHPFKIFGNYLKGEAVPSITSASWEKAFYGVENDRGFTDSRYDVKLDLAHHRAASFHPRGETGQDDLSGSPGKQSGLFNLLLTSCKNSSIQQPVLSKPLPARVSLSDRATKVFESEISGNLQKNTNEVWLFSLKGNSSAQMKGIMVEPNINVMVKDRAGKALKYPCRWLPQYLPNQSGSVRFDYCFPMMPNEQKAKIQSVEVLLRRTDNNPDAGACLEISDFALEILPLSGNPVSNQNSYF